MFKLFNFHEPIDNYKLTADIQLNCKKKKKKKKKS